MGETSLFWVKLNYIWRNKTIMNIYQTRNLAEFDKFFTQKTPVLHFWALTTFFSVIMVVFGEPLDVLGFTTQLSGLNPHAQIAITAVAGLIIIGLSRLILYIYAKRHSISPMGCLLWILVELIATIAVLCLTLWQISGCGKLALAPLAGDFLMGILIVEALPYLITYLAYRLQEEHFEVVRLQQQLDQLQPQEAFTTNTFNERTINFYDKGKRLVFSTASANILYIEAADNYVNIHYLNEGHEDTFILHNTLKETEKRLSDTNLIRCHRGYIINISNVKLLRKEGSTLLLELTGGNKTIPVTKTYASDITARLAPENI